MTKPEQKLINQFDKKAISFVIRIWREPQTTEEGEWRGWIEHVQTRERHYFRESSEINTIVSRYLKDQESEENSRD